MKPWMKIAIAFGAGVVLSGQVRKLPGGNMIPTV